MALSIAVESIVKGLLALQPHHFVALAEATEARSRRMMLANVKNYANIAPAMRKSVKVCHILNDTREQLVALLVEPELSHPADQPAPQ